MVEAGYQYTQNPDGLRRGPGRGRGQRVGRGRERGRGRGRERERGRGRGHGRGGFVDEFQVDVKKDTREKKQKGEEKEIKQVMSCGEIWSCIGSEFSYLYLILQGQERVPVIKEFFSQQCALFHDMKELPLEKDAEISLELFSRDAFLIFRTLLYTNQVPLHLNLILPSDFSLMCQVVNMCDFCDFKMGTKQSLRFVEETFSKDERNWLNVLNEVTQYKESCPEIWSMAKKYLQKEYHRLISIPVFDCEEEMMHCFDSLTIEDEIRTDEQQFSVCCLHSLPLHVDSTFLVCKKGLQSHSFGNEVQMDERPCCWNYSVHEEKVVSLQVIQSLEAENEISIRTAYCCAHHRPEDKSLRDEFFARNLLKRNNEKIRETFNQMPMEIQSELFRDSLTGAQSATQDPHLKNDS